MKYSFWALLYIIITIVSNSILIEPKDIQVDNIDINQNNNLQKLSTDAHPNSLSSQDKSQWLILQLSFLL